MEKKSSPQSRGKADQSREPVRGLQSEAGDPVSRVPSLDRVTLALGPVHLRETSQCT